MSLTPHPARDHCSHSSLRGFWLSTACMWLGGMGLGWWPSVASAVNLLVGPTPFWVRPGVWNRREGAGREEVHVVSVADQHVLFQPCACQALQKERLTPGLPVWPVGKLLMSSGVDFRAT